MFGAVCGTSPSVVFIENKAGVEAGGRTGIPAYVTAACFLPLLFFAPVASLVPSYATAPALVGIGILMFQAIRFLPLADLGDAIPAFATLALMPFTMSIEMGLIAGFVAAVGVGVVRGKWREVPVALYGLAILSVLLIVLQKVL